MTSDTGYTLEDYRRCIKAMADEVRQCMKEDPLLEESEIIQQIAESSEWYIYHKNAVLVLIYSVNADVGWSEGLIELCSKSSLWEVLSGSAFWAITRDIEEELCRIQTLG